MSSLSQSTLDRIQQRKNNRQTTGTSSNIATGFRGTLESIPLALEDIVSDARLFGYRLGGGRMNPFEGLQDLFETRQREDLQEFFKGRKDLERRIAAHQQKYAPNQQTGGGLVGNVLGYGLLGGGLGLGRNLLLRGAGRPTTVTGATVPGLAATEAALIPTLGDDPFSLGDNRMGNMLLAAGVGTAADKVLSGIGNRLTTGSDRRAAVATDPNFISTKTRQPLPRSSQQDVTEAAQIAQNAGYILDPKAIRSELPLRTDIARTFQSPRLLQAAMGNHNQDVTNILAKKILGADEKTPIESAISRRITELQNKYEGFRNIGEQAKVFKRRLVDDLYGIKLGESRPDILSRFSGATKEAREQQARQFNQFADSLTKIKIQPDNIDRLKTLLEQRIKLEKTLGGLGTEHRNVLNQATSILEKGELEPELWMDAIKVLRNTKSKLFKSGDADTGRIVGEISDILEDSAEKHFVELDELIGSRTINDFLPDNVTVNPQGQLLDASGEIIPDLQIPKFGKTVQEFKDARKQYSQAEAIREATVGDMVDAEKIYNIGKAKPLTDELETIANTYEYFGTGQGTSPRNVMQFGKVDVPRTDAQLGTYTLAQLAGSLASPVLRTVLPKETHTSALLLGGLQSQPRIRSMLMDPAGFGQRNVLPQPLGLLDRTLQKRFPDRILESRLGEKTNLKNYPNVSGVLNKPGIGVGGFSRQLLAPALGAGTSTFAVDQTDLL